MRSFLAWAVMAGTICGFSATTRGGDFFLDEADESPATTSPDCDACDSACGFSGLAGCELSDCGDCFCGGRRVLGLLPSDHCFDRFISPISNPFFFEDPRSLTEVRGIFLGNTLPRGATQGGDIQVWAAQARGRITDRWSLIAPRIADMQINNPPNGHPNGFMSAPIGVKYNFFRDVDSQFLASAGGTYFIPGSNTVFQGFGNGDFHFFLTAGKQIFGRGHWLSGTGFRIPANQNWGTQFWYWSNQWDYELPGHIYPLMGVNWFHWMRSSGTAATTGITGLDLFNLPAGSVAGSNFATYVIGAKWKPSGHVEVGAGWEVPITQNHDLMGNRVYADLIFRY